MAPGAPPAHPGHTHTKPRSLQSHPKPPRTSQPHGAALTEHPQIKGTAGDSSLQCKMNFIECEESKKAVCGWAVAAAAGHSGCAWPRLGDSGSSRSPLRWPGLSPWASRAGHGRAWGGAEESRTSRRLRRPRFPPSVRGCQEGPRGLRKRRAAAPASARPCLGPSWGRLWLHGRPGSSRAGTSGRSSDHQGQRAPRDQSPPS